MTHNYLKIHFFKRHEKHHLARKLSKSDLNHKTRRFFMKLASILRIQPYSKMQSHFTVRHFLMPFTFFIDEGIIMKNVQSNFINIFCAGLISITAGFYSLQALAAGVDTDDFIEEASAKGIAEIETGKLALQKSTSSEVKNFAKKMIEDHATSNRELRALASKKNIEMADDAELMAKAKKAILKQRDGESFDAAYVNNQIDAHKATIELYKDASSSNDEDVRQLAATSLPKLERHLTEAEALAAIISGNSKNIKMDDDGKADHH